MFKYIINLVLIGLLSLSSLHAQTINTAASKASFEVSNMAFRTVKGTLNGMQGTVDFDPQYPEKATFEVCIIANSIDTKSKKRDDHLKKDDFFNILQYPKICFSSNTVQKSNTGFSTRGQLTMLGISKEIKILFTSVNNVLKGSFKLNRLDFGLGADTGSFLIGKEVTVDIECVLNKN